MKKFDVLGVIGIGAYGIVLKARNKKSNEISIYSHSRSIPSQSPIFRSQNFHSKHDLVGHF